MSKIFKIPKTKFQKLSSNEILRCCTEIRNIKNVQINVGNVTILISFFSSRKLVFKNIIPSSNTYWILHKTEVHSTVIE